MRDINDRAQLDKFAGVKPVCETAALPLTATNDTSLILCRYNNVRWCNYSDLRVASCVQVFPFKPCNLLINLNLVDLFLSTSSHQFLTCCDLWISFDLDGWLNTCGIGKYSWHAWVSLLFFSRSFRNTIALWTRTNEAEIKMSTMQMKTSRKILINYIWSPLISSYSKFTRQRYAHRNGLQNAFLNRQ